jgi:hypothetical protein
MSDLKYAVLVRSKEGHWKVLPNRIGSTTFHTMTYADAYALVRRTVEKDKASGRSRRFKVIDLEAAEDA